MSISSIIASYLHLVWFFVGILISIFILVALSKVLYDEAKRFSTYFYKKLFKKNEKV